MADYRPHHRHGGGSRRRAQNTAATTVAGSFEPETGESPPSRIVASPVSAPAAEARHRGIATSTALDDELEVSPTSSSLRHSPPHEELVQTTLQRSSRDDGFGFSLSNGVYDSGVYVGAVKHSGPAADKLHPYDRILKVMCSVITCALQQQQPFNGLCSGTTRVGRYQKKHSAFCLSIGLGCVQAGFPHLLSSGCLWSRGR